MLQCYYGVRYSILRLLLILVLQAESLADGVLDVLVLELLDCRLVMLRSCSQHMLLEHVDRYPNDQHQRKLKTRLENVPFPSLPVMEIADVVHQ